jgi:guanyl-specific ribonuclease Sa
MFSRHATVIATRHYTALQATYNLTINNVHTYYVEAGTTPVLVHNSNSCVPWITPDSLPQAEDSALNDTLSHIDTGTVPSDATAKRWGIPFENRDGDLPGASGPNSPYSEYRVSPPPGVRGAGPLRVVVDDQTGETY